MLARLLSPFQEFGFFAGLIYAIDRILQRLSPNLRLYFYELLAQPIPDEPLLPSSLSRALEMRQIGVGAPEIALMPARPDIKESRFKQNAICLGAFQKGRFIGHIWFCFDAYDEDEVRCTFVLPQGNQAVFDFDLFLFPEYRMGLGFVGIWNGANEFLRSRGIKCSFSRLTRFNLASRRAHHAAWCATGGPCVCPARVATGVHARDGSTLRAPVAWEAESCSLETTPRCLLPGPDGSGGWWFCAPARG